jgi:uncharacterized protein YegJ (DUF2314 family)
MDWLFVGAAVLLLAAAAIFLVRRRRRSRLISFVALLRESVTLDPAVVARTASRVWDADLGDGTEPGADGFVVGIGVSCTIMRDDRMFLINSFPNPYTPDVERTAEKITDLRVRSLFREHAAWFSCDALGVDGRTPEPEVREWYRRLGPLFAEFLDENCLLIFLPDSDLAFPINDDTEAALRSPDPIEALQETLTLPIVEVSGDDPAMVRAVEQARAEWPKLVAAFEAGAGENFSVKAPVTEAGNTEYIWITVTAVEGDRVYGRLANEPANLGALRLDSKVSVSVTDLNDWCYVDAGGQMVGGFTIAVVQKAAGRRK